MEEFESRFRELISLYPERFQLLDYIGPDKRFKDIPLFKGRIEGTAVDFQDGEYQLLFTERGKTEIWSKSRDPEVILFYLINQFVISLAMAYEVKNRIEGEDSRRQWMALQIQLLRRANDEWAERELQRYHYFLKTYPFKDDKLPNDIQETSYKLN